LKSADEEFLIDRIDLYPDAVASGFVSNSWNAYDIRMPS